MPYFIATIVLLFSFSSCVSNRKRPDLEQVEKLKPSAKKEWLLSYKQAQEFQSSGQFDLACDLYKTLAQEKTFPIYEVAWLRSVEVCPIEKQAENFGKADLDPSQIPPWLTEFAFEIDLKIAKDVRNEERLAVLMIDSSKKNLPKREKVKRMQVAIELAKKNQLIEVVAGAEERLRSLAPRFIENPDQGMWLDVADDFRQDMQFAKAIEFYRKIIDAKESSNPLRLQATKGIAKTYKLQRKMNEFLRWTNTTARLAEKVYLANLKNKKAQLAYLKTQIELVRARWTHNQYNLAFSRLKKLARQLKGQQSLAEVYWLMGRMVEERQDFKAAGEFFALAMQEPIADDDFREKVGWQLAWNLRKTKDFESSAKTFDELIAKTKNPFRRSRFTFWMAKTMAESGESAKARQMFQEVVTDDPVGYYGVLSAKELNRKIGFPSHKRYRLNIYEPQPGLGTDYQPLIIDWLTAVGESTVARDYLEIFRNKLSKDTKTSDSAWVYLYHLYAKNNLYSELFGSLYSLETEQRKRILNRAPELLFPKPFDKQVATAATQFQVRPEFIYAIMRQESAFNPEARSHADAFGLMQILPEVARSTAIKKKLEYSRPTDLFDPQVNIPIGAAFVDDLSKKYENRLLLIAASYNASDEAISGWLKTRFRGDTLEFIEDVPFEETQDYMKLILRNFIFYTVIENGSDPVEFPDWILDLGFSDT